MEVELKMEVENDGMFDIASASVKVEPSTSYDGYVESVQDMHGFEHDKQFSIKVEDQVWGTVKTECSEHSEEKETCHSAVNQSYLDEEHSTSESEESSSSQHPKRRQSIPDVLHGSPRKHANGSPLGKLNMVKREWNGREYKITDLTTFEKNFAKKQKKQASESCWENDMCGTDELDCLKSGLIEKRFHDDPAEDEYRCSICGHTFFRVQNLNAHLRLAHLGKTQVCAVCGKAFVHSHYLQEHMKFHRKRYERRSAGSSTQQDKKVEKSKQENMSDFEEPYMCSICDSSFKEIIEIQVHMRSHKMQKLQVCPVCGDSFFSAFTKHMSIHTGKGPHSCVVCGRKFINIGNLRRHFEKHTEDQPYKCAICTRTFLNSFELMKHVRVKHRKDGSSTSSGQKRKDV